jgi:hypothetical protein
METGAAAAVRSEDRRTLTNHLCRVVHRVEEDPDRFPENGIHDVGRDLGERLEHKTTTGVTGMRNDEVSRIDDAVSEEDDVDVERPWTIRTEPAPIPAALDVATDVQEFVRRTVVLDLNGRVQEPGLFLHPDRFCRIRRRRTDQYDPVVLEELRARGQVFTTVTQVGSQRQEASCHASF